MPEHAQRRYEFKIAESASERAQINRLLYQTFVLEIARYDDPGTGFLIDRFDRSNVYFVAIRNGRVCGTMAIHDGPVFSVASAMADSSVLARLRRPLVEARIFAVDSRCRFGVVFAGLACSVYQYAVSNGYANILISGLERRRGMYERMGFRPLGPYSENSALKLLKDRGFRRGRSMSRYSRAETRGRILYKRTVILYEISIHSQENSS